MPERQADLLIERIRNLAAAEQIRITQHAHEKMVEEEIRLDEVVRAIRSAEVLETYPEHRRGACCLICGRTETGRPLHLVCTTAQPVLVIYYGVRTETAEMGVSNQEKSERTMKCAIEGCAGIYEIRLVTHTVRYEGEIVVIDHVPAEVCSVCGDVLLTPETVRHIEALLRSRPGIAKTAPVYEYA